MNIKSFLLVLNQYWMKNIQIWKQYVNIGLDQPLHSISYCEKFIESIWTARKHNDSFVFLSWIDSFSKVEVWLLDNEKKQVWLGNCVFLELACVPIKRQSSDVKVPLRAYPTSTGYDLYAAESKILKPKERVLIKVELSFAISPGYCGRIIERSVLANVNGIVAFNGTVDADYRGTVCVLLFNLSDNKYKVEIGNQIAQLIIEKCYDVSFVEYNELPDKICSIESFGSSFGCLGKNVFIW